MGPIATFFVSRPDMAPAEIARSTTDSHAAVRHAAVGQLSRFAAAPGPPPIAARPTGCTARQTMVRSSNPARHDVRRSWPSDCRRLASEAAVDGSAVQWRRKPLSDG